MFTLGGLNFEPALSRPDLIAASIKAALENWTGQIPAEDILVTEIESDFSDTAEFCDHYRIPTAQTANCLIVAGRRGETITPAACLVPAHGRADINGIVRRQLGARQVSLASREFAVEASGQEYGSITIVGLPVGWPLLIDENLAVLPHLVIGGGLRKSKLLVPGAALAQLPGAIIMSLMRE